MDTEIISQTNDELVAIEALKREILINKEVEEKERIRKMQEGSGKGKERRG